MKPELWKVGDRIRCVQAGPFDDRPDQTHHIKDGTVYIIKSIKSPDIISTDHRVGLVGVAHPHLNCRRFQWLSRAKIYPRRVS